MQRDRFLVAERWLHGAETDIAMADRNADEFAARAAFHAQQAAEMAIKAVVIAASDDHPTTHASSELLRELGSLNIAVPADVVAAAGALDLYYLASRYPDAVGDADPTELVPPEDARRAIERGRLVIAFARSVVASLAANATERER